MRIPVLLLAFALGACDDFTPVSSSGFGAFEAAVAVTDKNIAVAWYDNRHGNDEIYMRLLDGDLKPLTAELRLTNNAAASYEADIAPLGQNLAVAWYDKQLSGNLRVRLGLWTPQGEARWTKSLTSPTLNARVPVLESVGDRLFIAWIEEVPGAGTASIYGAWFDSTGAFVHAPFRIASASPTTWNLNTGKLPDGRVALVFDAAFATQRSELYLALVDGSAVSLTQLSADDGFASTYPDIAANENNIAVSWQESKDGNDEIYLSRSDLDALQTTGVLERAANRITTTAGASIGAYLAWNGPVLGLAWNDDDSGQHEIWFQSFAQSGRALQGAQRLTNTPENSLIPSLVAYGKGFVLAWGEVILGSEGHDGGMSTTRSEIVIRHVE